MVKEKKILSCLSVMHVKKVVSGFGKKSCVGIGVRKPGNIDSSLIAMIWPMLLKFRLTPNQTKNLIKPLSCIVCSISWFQDYDNMELIATEYSMWYYSKSKWAFNPNQEWGYSFQVSWNNGDYPVGTCHTNLDCPDVTDPNPITSTVPTTSQPDTGNYIVLNVYRAMIWLKGA